MQAAPIVASLLFADAHVVQLSTIQPGQQFVTAADPTCVFAILSHQQVGVVDTARRWCVAISIKNPSPHYPGELVSLDSLTNVFPVAVRHPALYCVV